MLKNWLFIIAALAFSTAKAQYTVNGNATQISCNEYRLTSATNGLSGSVWNNNKIDLTQPFDFKFDVFLGSNDSPGADGIAFVLQPISTSVGSSGGGLGYQGISPAVGVTLDTYQNAGDNDPAYDHIAVQLNGDLSHNTANNIAGPVQLINGVNNIEDGQWHALRVAWDAAAQKLDIYVDGGLRLTTTKNFIADVFSGNPMVFWGFTGSTGGENNLQKFRTALNPAYTFLPGQKRCVNESIQFHDSTVSFTTIAKFYWDFGDGSPIDSVNLNPVHTYTTGNIYTVKQRVIGADGCEATNTQMMTIGTKPVADLINTGGNCAPTGVGPDYPPALVKDASVITFGSPGHYYWDFGGGQVFSGTQSSISFNYVTAGDKLIRHSVTSLQGCESDTVDKYIHVYGHPLVDFTFTDSVCLGQPTSFLGTISPAPGDTAIFTWGWTFSNSPSQAYNVINPSYTYTGAGNQTALLVASPQYASTYCWGSKTKVVFVTDKPVAYFKYNTVCQSSVTAFTDSSYNADGVSVSQWWWHLNGGITGTQNTITTTYANPGTDTVKLVVHNSKGCASDTLKKLITINAKPVAKFGISKLLCDGQAIQFSDSSTAAGNTISGWSWLYNNIEWSPQQNTVKIFTQGNQTVKLVATSAAGCKSDTALQTFHVNPVPSVTMNFKDACKFAPVNFSGIDNSGTVTQWKWEFGDGGIAGTQNAQHTYSANGTYKVKLYALAATGCFADTLKDDIIIYGTNAFAGNDTIAAAGQPLQLHASGGLSYTWSPANLLNDAFVADPVAILNSTQLFTLKAFTPEGCESYDDVLVKIYKGPEIYLPNAFTPNGDGRNDVFRGIPVGLQQFEYLKVFNRWGQLVFYSTDHHKGWDGNLQGLRQPAGVYVVMARGKDYMGNIIEKKGTILLIR